MKWLELHTKCLQSSEPRDKLFLSIVAYEADKSKLESLYEVIKVCRENNWVSVAYTLCKDVLDVSKPSEIYEGYRADVYDFLLRFEMSIVAFYQNDAKMGLECCNKVLLTPNVPDNIKSNALANLMFYVAPLNNCVHRELIYPDNNPGWNLFNPGMCLFENEVIINCRLANSGGMWFTLNDGKQVSPSHPIRTENVRTKLNSKEWKMFHCEHNLPSAPRTMVKGLEDCRLFTYRNKVWFAATAKEFSRNGNLCEMFIGDADELVRLKPPPSFPPRNEKNWLPFEYEDRLRCVYSYEPFVTFTVDCKTGECEIFKQKSYSHVVDMTSFRGSAGPVYCKENKSFYIIVHEVIGHPDRFYFHRILKLNKDLELTHISLPFQMLGDNKIEYVCGCVIDNQDVLISYGDNDNKGMLAKMTLIEFDHLCLPL